MKRMTLAAMAVLAMAATARAQINSSEAERLQQAAEVLRESRAAIPQNIWDKAHCIAVIPDLKKAALIVGGEYGKGVMSCRTGDGWSAPLFLQLAKGSWGFQAGAQEVDLVMLMMNASGVQKLLKNNVALGVDASVAAGPVGRQAQAATDATLTAEILAYSRAQGLFAGINLSGGVVRSDEDPNRDAYGPRATPSTILASRSLAAPVQATVFLDALVGTSSTTTAAKTTPEREVPPQATGAVAANREPVTTDSDLRTQIVSMQQTLDRMLAQPNGSAVGTSGQVGDSGQMVTVSRERLEQLRSQIDSLLAALNARGL